MKNTVIYHRADFDGLFSREIARLALGDLTTEYIGWDYGDPLPVIPPDVETIYMIDISVAGMMEDRRLVWIDHHKSAIEKFSPSIKGYRIDGVAACRLAWQYFFSGDEVGLPGKEAYIDRQLVEPIAVRLAGEYDIWDKRDSRAELFQHGLRSVEELDWRRLLSYDGCEDNNASEYVARLLDGGLILQRSRARENESVIKAQGFTLQFEGLTFLACNAARYNSHLFVAGLKPEHDACLGFNWDGQRQKWRISLYGVPGKPDIDLSAIAVRYGGGGHKQACGFESLALPFTLVAA